MNLKKISDIKNLKGKKVLLRADFNVSIKNNEVAEEFRIKKTLPTIDFLIKEGARIIIVSHIDKKEGGSLLPVFRYLLPFYPKIRFIEDVFSDDAIRESRSLQDGSIILFENLRNWPEEEGNVPSFAKHLAGLADVYVNDGFSVSHREHASIIGIPQFIPSYAGLLLSSEVETLSKTFHPEHPFLFVLGGAKFETKLPLVKKFTEIADHLFVGGALANDLLKEKGFFIGDSLVSNVDVSSYVNNEKIIIPIDVRTQYKGYFYTKKPSEISVNEKIWDIGPSTSKFLKGIANSAKLIVWNGPMGNYEQGFTDGTKEIAEVIAQSGAKTIVGGGDVVTVLSSLGMLDKFYFVSTGGAAMLQFLAEETLPGIKVLENSEKKEEKKSFLQKIFS